MSNLLKIFFLAITLSLSAHIAHAKGPISDFEQAMAQHKGKVIYVDFWASWCVPCRKSFPWMNAMQTKHQDQGFVVLSINLDAEERLAKNFLQQTPANFAIIYDANGKLARHFKVKGMPSSYLFDRQGQLISAHSGFNDKKKQLFEQEIKQALLRR
jgi:thiol-disulfide isomerase/thioredoxin